MSIEPDIEIESRRSNLMEDKTLDSLYGWGTHGVWPNADGVVTNDLAPVSYTHLTLPTNREV